MKKYLVSVFLVLVTFLFVGCKTKERAEMSDYVDIPPETNVSANVGIDFNEMHNTILDSMMSDVTPFFYVKDGCFDISGSNKDPKSITLTADCMGGTTEHDAALFISYVLTSIGDNAAEQNYKYKPCSQDGAGNYLDFGTVFNEYTLILKVTADGKKEGDAKVTLYDLTIKPGEEIPIDSKYWSN